MANQRDVATLAGVSSATVSRYLSKPELVKPDTAKEIQKAIESLNYKIDSAARTLKTGRTYHVCILIPGSAPFYWILMQTIQQRLSEAGYYSSVLFTRQFDDQIPHNDIVDQFVKTNQVEGFIFFPLQRPEDKKLLSSIKKLHNNYVIVDFEPEDKSNPHVFFNNYQAGWEAAGLFLKKGHRKILLLKGDDIFDSSRQRQQGFIDRLAKSDIDFTTKHMIPCSYTADKVFPLFKETDFPEFTAVFAPNDTTGAAFIRAMSEKGINCPKDYELIAFDNNMEFAPYFTPSLSSFHQPLYEAGIYTAGLLLSLLNNEPAEPSRSFPVELVYRESFSR